MLARSAEIPWKSKRQLSDPPAALKRPEVVSGATAIFGIAVEVSKCYWIAWSFLYLGLGGHHFWHLWTTSFRRKKLHFTVYKMRLQTALGESFLGKAQSRVLALVVWLLLGLQLWPQCEPDAWQPVPCPAQLLPCCTGWNRGRREFGLLKLLHLYGSSHESQGEIFVGDCFEFHHPESLVAGEGREKLSVSS